MMGLFRQLLDWVCDTKRFVRKVPAIRWRKFIGESKSKFSFNSAFRFVYGYSPEECGIILTSKLDRCGMESTSLIVLLPNVPTITVEDNLGSYTDNPILERKKDVYYEEGQSKTGYDLRSRPYYKINPKTGFPMDWARVRAKEVIIQYVKENREKYTWDGND